MNPLRRFFVRLSTVLFRKRDEARMREEMEEHLARQTADNIRSGMTPAEARRQAALKFGGVPVHQEDYRDLGGLPGIENLWRDARFAIRQLGKNPGFTATAILMLALGMCASIAIFTFVDAALLQPLPYRNPDRVVGVYENIPVCPRCNLSYPDYVDFKKLNSAFTSLDVYTGSGFSLNSSSGAQLAMGARVSAGFFNTLGVAPIVGRDFLPGEDAPAAPLTVILSHATWQTRYGGRREILGQTIALDGDPYLVIGVLPADFHFAPIGQPEFWAPLRVRPGCLERRSCHGIYGVARLKDGVELQTALADVKTIAQQLEKQYPDSNRGQGATVVAMTDVIVGDIRPILLLLLGGAGLLLVIAGVNVANLLLVRGESRKREIAVRSALGGSTARLFSQFVTEGVMLVTAGSALGLLAAGWLMQGLLRMIPQNLLTGMPYLRNLGLHAHAWEFAVIVSVLGAALFSLAPISRLSLAEMREGLASGSRGSAGTTWRRFGTKLVVLELATAVVLLVGAGLLGKSLYRILHLDVGFQPEHLATLRVSMPRGYAKNEQIAALGRRLVSETANLPGVKSVGLTSTLPLMGGNTVWIRVMGHPYNGEHNEVSFRDVSPAYFTTLQARLVRGRFFREEDDASKPPVVLINRKFASKYFPGEEPLGKQILYAPTTKAPPMEVVGIVDDLRESPADKDSLPTMYLPFNQDPATFVALLVRTSQMPESVLPALVSAIRQIDPGISTFDIRTMSQRINESPAAYMRRASALLVGGFAALALLLSVVGLYGVVAYSVSQRTREIGVRMALGAQRGAVYQLILNESGRLAGVGVLLGLIGAVGVSMLIRGLLFGVDPWDVGTLAGVALVLGLSALVASFLPARRAASINPVDALRAE